MVLAARREALVQEAAAAAGDGAIGVRADVTNEDDVAALVARAVDEFGHVDVMCNNAAAPGQDTWIWEQTLENWNATIDIDVTAAMLCTREVLRQSMLERRSGVILNFSSTASYGGVPRKTHYVTAKAALRAFTKAVALEVGPHGIRCNCIVPGAIDTELWQNWVGGPRRSRASTTRPNGRGRCGAPPSATSRRPRTWPTSRCSSPATRAARSPGSRSPSTPAATCRAELRPHRRVDLGERLDVLEVLLEGVAASGDTDDGRAGRRGLGEHLLRATGLADRVEPARRAAAPPRSRPGAPPWRSHSPAWAGPHRERAPAVGQRDRPAQRAQRAPADPERDVVLHRAGIDDQTLEVVVLAVVGGLGLGQGRPEGAQRVVGAGATVLERARRAGRTPARGCRRPRRGPPVRR